jgi:hypothetical protein
MDKEAGTMSGCLICNPEARAALDDEGARTITEDIAREYPPDIIRRRLEANGITPDTSHTEYAGRLQCWNCAGKGFTA